MNNNISPDATITESIIGSNVKVYKDAELKKTQIDDYVSIGNQTIIVESQINSNTLINRRNYILRSKIGSYTYTGIGTMIRSANIGKFCSISWNVSIGGGNHNYYNVTTSPSWRFQSMDTGNIDNNTNIDLKKTFAKQKLCIIGNDVWIASNVVILRDLKIGNGAVIGAGSVVNRDVDPYSIVVGIPSRVIKKRFDEKTITELEKIQWWNWPKETIRNNLDLVYSSPVNESVLRKMTEISNEVNKMKLGDV